MFNFTWNRRICTCSGYAEMSRTNILERIILDCNLGLLCSSYCRLRDMGKEDLESLFGWFLNWWLWWKKQLCHLCIDAESPALGWLGWSTFPTGKGWGSCGCSAWGRQGSRGTSLQPFIQCLKELQESWRGTSYTALLVEQWVMAFNWERPGLDLILGRNSNCDGHEALEDVTQRNSGSRIPENVQRQVGWGPE